MRTRQRLALAVALAVIATGTTFASGRQPSDSAEEERNRLFPLGKSLASDYDLPRPVGLNFVLAYQGQVYGVANVDISKDGEPVPLPPDLTDTKVDVDATAFGVRGDLWVLPFVNVYGTVGRTDVDVNVRFPTIPAQDLSFSGVYWAAGFVLPAAYKNLFGTLEFTTARASLESDEVGLDSDWFRTDFFAARIGYRVPRAEIWIGARWQSNEEQYSGTIDDDVDFSVEIEAATWGFVTGMHYSINERFELIVEGGLGERKSITANYGYRF